MVNQNKYFITDSSNFITEALTLYNRKLKLYKGFNHLHHTTLIEADWYGSGKIRTFFVKSAENLRWAVYTFI